MAKHDFTALFSKYPEAISLMKESFDSHEFILRLAQTNQTEYVEALYAYKDSRHGDKAAPFKAVHTQLASHLSEYPALIEQDGVTPSVDIFGQPNEAISWRKVRRKET